MEGESLSSFICCSKQFKDLIILVLLAAALVSGVVGEWVDTAVILVICHIECADRHRAGLPG